MNLEESIIISDQSIKVNSYYDDRIEKFTRLEMDVQSHFMTMLQKEVEIRSDREKLLALRHARLTMSREAKRISRLISKNQDEVDRIDRDLLKIEALMTPKSIGKGKSGIYWAALSKYIRSSQIVFESTEDLDMVKDIDRETGVPLKIPMIASQFVSKCRFSGYLVAEGTGTSETLFRLINSARVECNRMIEQAAVEVDSQTASLHSILEPHWNRQGI